MKSEPTYKAKIYDSLEEIKTALSCKSDVVDVIFIGCSDVPDRVLATSKADDCKMGFYYPSN